MANKNFDFVGWATKYNIKCADGRTIMNDAFSNMDGKRVPMVWNHQHNSTGTVLGHSLLKCFPEGVKAYCSFNETPAGKDAKLIVEHGDVESLSILAFPIQETSQKHVMHGDIKEVSLVLSGANPGATIIDGMSHSDDGEDSEYAVIYSGEGLEFFTGLEHSDEPEKKEEVKETKEETPAGDEHPEQPTLEHSDEGGEATIGDILESMTEEQRNAALALAAGAYEDGKNSAKESDENEGGTEMKHSLFQGNVEPADNQPKLTHDQLTAIFTDAKKFGSLKDSFMAHAGTYGINNIDYLFPDATNLDKEPQFIMREQDWVPVVMNGVHHTPFSRIKSMFADITADEARAKGYTKGNRKIEEVFSLLKRETTPTTIYKKQKLDRDDVIDIVDIDVVAWIKKEMRMMLNEEIARAVLIGDGRLSSSQDKISETNIRPVWTDDDFYTVKIKLAADATTEAKMEAIIRSRKQYKGSGNVTFFTTEDFVTDMLLLKDTTGRIIYDSMDKLMAFLRVSKIVTVPLFEGAERTIGEGASAETRQLIGLYLNLNDYNIGADKGGAVSMFDDFDIDYNQMKYLIETRCSGALTKFHSAVAIEQVKAAG